MIVFPMCGLSQRFKNMGYKEPKYKLSIGGHTMFNKVLSGFREFFNIETFLFITIKEDVQFVLNELEKLRIYKYIIKDIPIPTNGQAETVALGLNSLSGINPNKEYLTIFNIDTIHNCLNIPKDIISNYDGFLEVFIEKGEQWSFVKPELEFLPSGKVLETTEKIRISNLCSTGLYGFKNISLYLEYFQKAKEKGLKIKNEYYIAPIYNLLIKDNYNIGYFTVERNCIQCVGTPNEYSNLINRISNKLTEFNY